MLPTVIHSEQFFVKLNLAFHVCVDHACLEMQTMLLMLQHEIAFENHYTKGTFLCMSSSGTPSRQLTIE